MGDKKQSEKAIDECVDFISEFSSGITKEQARSIVMEPLRVNFEKHLDSLPDKEAEALWRSHRPLMKKNCRYLATFAEFFALHDAGIQASHLQGAFRLVKHQCNVGAPGTVQPQYIYCNGGGKVAVVEDLLAALLKP